MSITVSTPKDEEEDLPTAQTATPTSFTVKAQLTEFHYKNVIPSASDLKERKPLLSLKTAQIQKSTTRPFQCRNLLTLNKANQTRIFQKIDRENVVPSLNDEISIVTEATVNNSSSLSSSTSALKKIPSLLKRKNPQGLKENHKQSAGSATTYTNGCFEEYKTLKTAIESKTVGQRPASKLSLSFNALWESGTATKRQAESTLTINPSLKPKKLRIMSLYERQYPQSDDRPTLSNGYLSSRNSSAGHTDDGSSSLTNANNYYSSSSQISATANGGSNAIVHAPSMASLCNIGNTCYLNSVVYTLRFAPLFLHNLHHLVVDLASIQQNIGKHRAKSSSLGRNISGLHMENARSWSSKDLASLENYGQCDTQKSSQQVATEKLHELYQNLHRNEISETTEPFHADTFLHAIQEVSAIFEGNQQQDAHEFLMCVLDSIRETCQLLIKAISDCPDVIVNGCVSLPEQLSESGPDQNNINYNSSSINCNNNNTSSSKSTSSSLSTANIMKASFFSRKSKRKDESKNSKNQRLQSPLKDNAQQQMYAQQPANAVTLNSGVFVNSTSDGANYKSSSPVADDDLITKDKERLAEKIKKLGLDFFTEDFEGMTVSTTKCLSCETVTEQKETMIDIAVPVPITGYTETSNSFIQNSCITREYFRDKNKYRCEQCTGYTEAIRSISYEVLPRLLVIQLSRFSGGMEKINSYIPTPFTMQCFCAKCEQRDNNNKLHAYKLYSVITHVGATMSVGHYIAYTCSLDWANEYVNCPKDRRRHPNASSSSNSSSSPGSAGVPTRPPPSASSSSLSAGTGLMKKMKFGRSKASSSGDMSKNIMKNINGLTSKSITNGIEKLSMNTTCQSINCCASLFRNAGSGGRSSSYSSSSSYSNGPSTNGAWNDLVDDINSQPQQINGSHINSNYNYLPGYGSTGRSKSSSSANQSSEPIWYMCDDDKIKAMTQREFEELLSPTRKITITPYLLFYARFDLQSKHSMSATGTADECGM